MKQLLDVLIRISIVLFSDSGIVSRWMRCSVAFYCNLLKLEFDSIGRGSVVTMFHSCVVWNSVQNRRMLLTNRDGAVISSCDGHLWKSSFRLSLPEWAMFFLCKTTPTRRYMTFPLRSVSRSLLLLITKTLTPGLKGVITNGRSLREVISTEITTFLHEISGILLSSYRKPAERLWNSPIACSTPIWLYIKRKGGCGLYDAIH